MSKQHKVDIDKYKGRHSNAVIVGEFNTPLISWIDHPNRINEKAMTLNDTLNQIYFIDIF